MQRMKRILAFGLALLLLMGSLSAAFAEGNLTPDDYELLRREAANRLYTQILLAETEDGLTDILAGFTDEQFEAILLLLTEEQRDAIALHMDDLMSDDDLHLLTGFDFA